MMPEAFEAGIFSDRANLLWMLGINVLLLAGAAHAWLQWRRFREGPLRIEARPYRGWIIAYLILLACFQLGLAPYWQRVVAGTVVEADVQEVQITVSRRRITTTHYALIAVSANAERWRLQDDFVDGRLALALKDRLDAKDGPVRVPFVVVRFTPQNHQLGSQATAHPVLLLGATLVLLVLFPTYAIEAPRLRLARGGQFLDAFLDRFADFFEALFEGLLGLVSAALDQLWAITAIFAVAFFASPRLRGEPLSAFDMIPLLVAAACLCRLLWRSFGPETRTLNFHRTGYPQIPTISIFHFVFDAGWIALGVMFLQPPRDDVSAAFGIGFVAVPALLTVARLIGWLKRSRID